jgi:hypothetical protein
MSINPSTPCSASCAAFFDIVKEFDEEQKNDPEALPQKT